MADEHEDETGLGGDPVDRAHDGAHDDVGAALDGIEGALDEVASALARMG